MTASVSRSSSTAVDGLQLAGSQAGVTEPLAGDVADALGARGHAGPRYPAGHRPILDRMATTASRTAEDRKERLAQQRTDAARRTRGLPVPRREGARHLRREGEVDPQPRDAALLRAARRLRDGQRDRPHRVRPRLQRGRGAARRAELHQAVQAALQRPPARRQVLSVHRDLDGRGVPARLLHARAPPPRPRCTSARTPTPSACAGTLDLLGKIFLFRSCTGVEPGRRQRLALPGLLHQALRRAVRRLRLGRGVPRVDRRGSRVPRRGATARSSATSAAHEGGRGQEQELRAGGARAQPPARGPLAARAPAGRQRVGRHARRGGGRRGRHRRERPGLPGPRRRAHRPPVLLPLQRRPSARSATSPRSSSCSTTAARWRSRRRSSSRAGWAPTTSTRWGALDRAARGGASRCGPRSAATSGGSSTSPSATRVLAMDTERLKVERRHQQRVEALDALQARWGSTSCRIRIECFDISNLMGTNTVAAWSCSRAARPRSRTTAASTSAARPRASRTTSRRWRRSSRAGATRSGSASRTSQPARPEAQRVLRDAPSLIVIDGGPGQLAAGLRALRAVARPRRRGRLAGQADRGGVPARRARAAAPRRTTRRLCSSCSASATRRTASRSPITARGGTSEMTTSMLDELPGIGPSRKRACSTTSGRPRACSPRPASSSRRCPGSRARSRARSARSCTGPATDSVPGVAARGAHLQLFVQECRCKLCSSSPPGPRLDSCTRLCG